jgi:hypothetical protein
VDDAAASNVSDEADVLYADSFTLTDFLKRLTWADDTAPGQSRGWLSEPASALADPYSVVEVFEILQVAEQPHGSIA